jgi:hypothetical protein
MHLARWGLTAPKTFNETFNDLFNDRAGGG